MTDARGFASPCGRGIAQPPSRERRSAIRAAPQPAPPAAERGFGELLDIERGASFMYPGGLVAVHARGRDREAIWDALAAPRGLRHERPAHPALVRSRERARTAPRRWAARSTLREAPRFEVRAVGSFVQQPGCPAESVARALARATRATLWRRVLPPGRRARTRSRRSRWCASGRSGRPASRSAPLIEDPWRRFECAPDPAGCVVAFEDPEFATSGARRRLLRARAPGADAGGQRREPAHASSTPRATRCASSPATATGAARPTTTASRPCRSAPGRRRSSWIVRAASDEPPRAVHHARVRAAPSSGTPR